MAITDPATGKTEYVSQKAVLSGALLEDQNDGVAI